MSLGVFWAATTAAQSLVAAIQGQEAAKQGLETGRVGDDAALRAAMYLNGASSEEELDSYELERLQVLGKVMVNAPGRNARAILTEYQLAALEDYRRRCGDILSWEELALVDGFGKEAVEALRPYLSLWSGNLPGAVDTLSHFKADVLIRATEKNIGTKLKAEGKWWQLAGAVRSKSWQQIALWLKRDASAGSPDWTASAEFGNGRWSVLVGDFNVRYGQAIGVWSGFSMSSLSTVDAFIKRPTGIRPLCSFTPSEHRGAAAQYHLGRWSFAAFGDVKGNAGAHAGYVAIHSQMGLTAMPGQFSGDFACNWKGVNLAGEVAVRFPVKRGIAESEAAVSGAGSMSCIFKLRDVKLALQGRAIPSQFSGRKNGEYGAAAGVSWKSQVWQQLKGREGFGSSVSKHVISLTADASLLPVPQKDPGRKQLRMYGLWQWQISGTMALDAKYTGRYRNWEPSRSDLRLDMKYSNGQWSGISRLEGNYCSGPGILGYLEIGHKRDITGLSGRAGPQGWAAYLRIGTFNTSGWASRIYCYERDAPGTFTVPAYSGQGVTGSLYGTLKTRLGKHLHAKACLRAACVLKKAAQPVPSLHFQLEIQL